MGCIAERDVFAAARIPGLNEARLAYWRCNVRARGVAAEPITPGWCVMEQDLAMVVVAAMVAERETRESGYSERVS